MSEGRTDPGAVGRVAAGTAVAVASCVMTFGGVVAVFGAFVYVVAR